MPRSAPRGRAGAAVSLEDKVDTAKQRAMTQMVIPRNPSRCLNVMVVFLLAGCWRRSRYEVDCHKNPCEADRIFSHGESHVNSAVAFAACSKRHRPDERHVSTSYIERQNLTMRMRMRRFSRLTNAFSKKLKNHIHALAVYVLRLQLRVDSSAVAIHARDESRPDGSLWTLEEMVGLIPELKYNTRPKKSEA